MTIIRRKSLLICRKTGNSICFRVLNWSYDKSFYWGMLMEVRDRNTKMYRKRVPSLRAQELCILFIAME